MYVLYILELLTQVLLKLKSFFEHWRIYKVLCSIKTFIIFHKLKISILIEQKYINSKLEHVAGDVDSSQILHTPSNRG